VEATGEDSLATSTCAEAAAGAVTVEGAVATGASGTARGGHGRPSDKAINRSVPIVFDILTVKYSAVNHILVPYFFIMCS
jgi:hypothetical protein